MKEIVLPDCPPPFIAHGAFDGRQHPAAQRGTAGSLGSSAWCCCAPMIEFAAEESWALLSGVARFYAEADDRLWARPLPM